MTIKALPNLARTGIGSLPSLETTLALDGSFSLEIPYLPTFPAEGGDESMLHLWESGRDPRAWPEFLARCRREKPNWAKVQLIGPLTLGLSLAEEQKLKEAVLDLQNKALDWVRALSDLGVTPIFFWDEPGLGAADRDPLLFQEAWEQLGELSLMLMEAGARVGVHCCAATDLSPLMRINLDILSFDTSLCLDSLLGKKDALKPWLAQGGTLALGAVPTEIPQDWRPPDLLKKFQDAFGSVGKTIFQRCLLTPACGLGTRSLEETEKVFKALAQLKKGQGR